MTVATTLNPVSLPRPRLGAVSKPHTPEPVDARHPDVPAVHPAGPRLHLDLGAVAANTRLLAGRATALAAVVKADGFGHGAGLIAGTALAHGASSLGVTSIDEALALRTGGCTAPILSWLNPVDADFAAALAGDVDLAVPSTRHLHAIACAAALTGHRARVHLHVDTGMSRDGAEPARWRQLCELAASAQRRGLLDVVGVMSHLGCADASGCSCTDRALIAFEAAVDTARAAGLRPRVRHLAATAATLTDPRTRYDLSRVGAGLVGIDPAGGDLLRPALTLTAPVVSVRDVAAGARVGYGHAYEVPSRTRLALLPLGYGDGLPRAASGRAQVWLGGRLAPVVGLVSMDQVVVDVGDRPIAPGDVAVVFGPGDRGEPTAAAWAAWAGTIEHEVVTGLGRRIHRTVGPAELPAHAMNQIDSTTRTPQR